MSSSLFQEIAESIRRAVIYGEMKAGDELPPVREMAVQWNCAPGTVQRAYRELAQQGFVTSRPGQGTRVAKPASLDQSGPLRRAKLANETEAFLLQLMSSGYAVNEVEQAVRLVLDRWRAAAKEAGHTSKRVIRFVGSHDPSLSRIADQFDTLATGYRLQIAFAGSLGGLIALAEGQADISSCHLWDSETDSYNIPFVKRLLPGERVALVTLAHRHLGIMLAPTNPSQITNLADLANERVRFINRQPGAGTRVWFDAQLAQLRIPSAHVYGYEDEVMTHTDVARAVADGEADAGLGIETAALTYGLDFMMLTSERYDLVIPEHIWELSPIQKLLQWLSDDEGRTMLSGLQGYDVANTGQVRWIA